MTGREMTEQSIAFIVLLLNLKSSQPSCSQHRPSQDLVIPSPLWILPDFILINYHISMKCFTPLKHPMAHPQSNLSKPYLPSEKL